MGPHGGEVHGVDQEPGIPHKFASPGPRSAAQLAEPRPSRLGWRSHEV